MYVAPKSVSGRVVNTSIVGALVLLDREDDVRADAAPDPVALHQLDRVGPVEQVEIGEQAVRVRR